MKLQEIQVRYRTAQAGSGYDFQVDVVLDEEWGWAATVALRSLGHKTPEGAALALRGSAQAFLMALDSGVEREPVKAPGDPSAPG